VVTLQVNKGTFNCAATSKSICSARSSSKVSMVMIGFRELMSKSSSSRLPGFSAARGGGAVLLSFPGRVNLIWLAGRNLTDLQASPKLKCLSDT